MQWRKLLILSAAFILLLAIFGCTSSPDVPGTSPTSTPTVPPPTSTPTVPPPSARSTLPPRISATTVGGAYTPSLQPSEEGQPTENTVYYLSWQRDGELDQSEIWKTSLDGTDQRLIYQRTRQWETVEVLGGISVESWGIEVLELSPDGKKLAFADLLGYGTEPGPHIWFYKQASVWVINVDGSHPVELLEFTAEDGKESECIVSKIVWSPDSTRILIHRNCVPHHPDIILVVNVLTGEVTEIGPGSGGSWSPDGQYVAYARNRHPSDLDDVYGLYVATADGREKKLVLQWNEFEGYNAGPEWSPDGERLVFSDGNSRVYTISRDGTQLRQLLEGYTYPQWSPDGKYVSLIRESEYFALYAMDVHNGHIWRLWSQTLPESVEWSVDSEFLLVETQGQSGGVYYVRVEDGARFSIPVSGGHPTW